jgi:hypothetical protein
VAELTELAKELAALPGLPFATAAGIGLRRLVRFLLLSTMVFFVAFIPVIGSLIAPPAQFLLTAHTLGGELFDPFLSRRGMLRAEHLTDRRELERDVREAESELLAIKRGEKESVDSVKQSAQLMNIAGMPILVILIALVLWLVRVNKRSQKMREDMA